MGDYRSLKVWRKAHQLTLQVYKLSAPFPASELYGLTSQLRRSASSIPANIAEGCGRNSDGELARFCRIALGSANELEYHLLLARDLGYLDSESHAKAAGALNELKSMLSAFVATVSRRADS